ncbi:MAG: RNA methyltransferase [Anaerolineaceae bacterium]
MEKITSSANPLVKKIRKLHDRKFRAETSLAYIEGVRIVLEAVQQNVPIEKLILSETFLNDPKREFISSKLKTKNIDSVIVTDSVFQAFSDKEGPQGIGAIISQKWLPFSDLTKVFHGIWVCLWEIADPGNLGTILRTMDGVGAEGVILTGNCTDPYDPGALRASMGALFSKNLVKSSQEDLIRWVKDYQIFTIGTSDSGKINYREVTYPANMLLMMGSERQGLPPSLTEICQRIVSIPMKGTADSLNLAVATGILLYEIYEQLNKVENTG